MTKNNLSIVFEEVFNTTLLGYLIFILVETISAGFVNNYFNLNYLLAVVVMSGIGLVLTKGERIEVQKKQTSDWYVVGALAIFSGTLVYYKTKEMGNISLVISSLAGLLVFLLAYMQESEDSI